VRWIGEGGRSPLLRRGHQPAERGGDRDDPGDQVRPRGGGARAAGAGRRGPDLLLGLPRHPRRHRPAGGRGGHGRGPDDLERHPPRALARCGGDGAGGGLAGDGLLPGGGRPDRPGLGDGGHRVAAAATRGRRGERAGV
ncbi:MAG: hypothetical protein AVDCRST_MAG59-4881, partial [uncultured Thermomicrobiales bacterium]